MSLEISNHFKSYIFIKCKQCIFHENIFKVWQSEISVLFNLILEIFKSISISKKHIITSITYRCTSNSLSSLYFFFKQNPKNKSEKRLHRNFTSQIWYGKLCLEQIKHEALLTTKILTSVSNILLKFSHSYFYCVYLHYPKNITLLIERKIYSWIRKIITPWQLSTVCVLSLSHVWLCDPMDCSLPGSSVQGILQTRILECIAIPFSRGFSQPRSPPGDCRRTQVSLAGRFFSTEPATWEAPLVH